MPIPSKLWSVLLAGSLGLGGCAVIPADDYGYYDDDRYYERETVIVTPPPRVEYRGVPPAVGHVWIDGYWNRIGPRPHWVPGYWNPPGVRTRPIMQHSPRVDPRPDGRHDRRDARDRERAGERRHDNERSRDGERWRDQARDDGRWPGVLPRRDGDRPRNAERIRDPERVRDPGRIRDSERVRDSERIRDPGRVRDLERVRDDGRARDIYGNGATERPRPQAGDREERRAALRVERERPPGAREGLLHGAPRPERRPRDQAGD